MRLHDPSGRLASLHSRADARAAGRPEIREGAGGAHREHRLARRSMLWQSDYDMKRWRELERTVRSTQLDRALDPKRSS
jgi:hypothetical protein